MVAWLALVLLEVAGARHSSLICRQDIWLHTPMPDTAR